MTLRSLPRLASFTSVIVVAELILAIAMFSGCGGAQDPASQQADRINGLWYFMLIVSIIVAVAVTALFVVALLRKRSPSRLDSARSTTLFTIVAGAIIPGIILVVVFAYSVIVLARDQHYDRADLDINVTARQFDYRFEYSGKTIVSDPELHLPAGRLIRLNLTSDDVIHSFWVPELQGKMDMFPGRTTTLWIEDARPGTYTAQCAEFCGLNHATMTLTIIVQPAQDFDTWLSASGQ